MIRSVKLSRQEKGIEEALVKGEYVNIDKAAFQDIAQTIESRRKDAVLNIRVNSQDLQRIKRKSKKLGIKYQTFISELLHRLAA